MTSLTRINEEAPREDQHTKWHWPKKAHEGDLRITQKTNIPARN